MTVAPAKKTAAGSKKSGIKTFKPGEELFKQGDSADSLFIIQKGQIRLFIPKGKGFVDLAILRSGEVIGEMAYFDEKSRRRSCSAAAIVSTEVIEISFTAFGKTMANLNPWFKTIINTLAERLRKTNDKVKALESNSVGFGSGGKVGEYIFFHNTDTLKLLGSIYMTFKTHSEKKEDCYELHINKLKFYCLDIFTISEVKFEEFLLLLEKSEFIKKVNDKDGLPKVLQVKDPEVFKAVMVFVNTQRATEESKKIKVSEKGLIFLKAIINQMKGKSVESDKAIADISVILSNFKDANIPVSDEHFKHVIDCGLSDDIVVGSENKLTATVNLDKIKKLYPALKIQAAIKAVNEEKSGEQKY